MITLITGAPGTGKTAAVVSMLRELSKDRLLYVCNLNELKIDHLPLEDCTKWHTDVPDGAVIVIDEVQNFWPPRGPGQKKPDWIAALETHRHRGIDMYIITQGPNLIDSNVRALVGRHVHLRELGLLGRWWYEWPECADNCRTGWKNAPIKRRDKLPKKIFGDYKSASIHVKPKRSVPIVLFILVGAIGFFGWKAWGLYSTISGRLADMGVTGALGVKPAHTAVASSSGGLPVQLSGSGQQKVIDDRVDWIPRISHRPETAPAYDDLRKVAVMPRVAGALVMGKRVRCVTQQGTDAGLTEAECRDWLERRPFDPYTLPEPVQLSTPSDGKEKLATVAQGPGLILLEGSGWRDPLGSAASSSSGAKR